MIYDWYKVFNKTEFEGLGLVSKSYAFNLEGIGEKEILVTKGNYVSMLYDDVFLCLNMNLKNPFEFEGHAIYVDSNQDVYLGVLVED